MAGEDFGGKRERSPANSAIGGYGSVDYTAAKRQFRSLPKLIELSFLWLFGLPL
jgi:hypothetical protein